MSDLFPQGIMLYLIGGLLIGAGVGMLFVCRGLIGGTSTVFTSTWSYLSDRPFFRQKRFFDSRGWRLVYSAGLVLGAFAYVQMMGEPFSTGIPAWRLLVGGLLIGFGARLSNGCTAGHGICGLASLQLPSLLAVLTFLTTAMVVAHAAQRLLGGS